MELWPILFPNPNTSPLFLQHFLQEILWDDEFYFSILGNIFERVMVILYFNYYSAKNNTEFFHDTLF